MNDDDVRAVEIKNIEIERKVADFIEILDRIESLEDRKKKLYREIYENALTDRQNSYAMFKQLYDVVKDKPIEHAVHGKTISSYLERMSRSNDQLIKLTDMIADEERRSTTIDPEMIYEKISGGKKSK